MRVVWRSKGWLLAAALVCMTGASASAQDALPHDAWATLRPPTIEELPLPELHGSASEDMPAGTDSLSADAPISAEDLARIENALMAEPQATSTPVKSLRIRRLYDANSDKLDVARAGSNTVVLKKPLGAALSEWDAKVGADLALAPDGSRTFNLNDPLRVPRGGGGSGAAWASVGVENFATVDARLSPASEQGQVATTFRHSVPLGGNMSMTLQSRTSLTESYGVAPTSLPDIPLAAAPVTDPGSPTPRVWGQENSAKLSIASTGTTLGAGVSTTSTDTVIQNTLSAEQKIYGPLNVTTAVNNVGQASQSRSLSARFRVHW